MCLLMLWSGLNKSNNRVVPNGYNIQSYGNYLVWYIVSVAFLLLCVYALCVLYNTMGLKGSKLSTYSCLLYSHFVMFRRPSYALYDGRHTMRTANVVSCVSRPPYNHHFVENTVGIWWQISPISIWWVIVLIGIKCAFLSCLSALHRFNSTFFIVEYSKTSFRKLIFCKKDEAYIENRIFICNFAHLNIYVIFECLYDHEENYSGCPYWCFTV